MPLVGTAPLFVTVMVYVAVWPCMKLPVWVFVMVKSGARAMGVITVAVLLAALRSPPPPTVATFVTDGGALLATLTVNVIGG